MLRRLASVRPLAAASVRYASTRPTILAVSTMDTKAEELKFVADCIRRAGCAVEMADVSCSQGVGTHVDAHISRETVAAHHPEGAAAVLDVEDRGEAVSAMTTALTHYVKSRAFDGIVGIGGSGGTALITPAMQALPVGKPKVMVTTMAAGDVSAYVGASDVTIMPSVVDVAGLNSISRAILGNAAAAVSGMALHPPPAAPPGAKPTLAVTMFGVTTPARCSPSNQQREPRSACLLGSPRPSMLKLPRDLHLSVLILPRDLHLSVLRRGPRGSRRRVRGPHLSRDW